MIDISTKDLLPLLIHTRTSLKIDKPEEALKTIRDIIKHIDPDRAIEDTLRRT
jgi:hypothetical protein